MTTTPLIASWAALCPALALAATSGEGQHKRLVAVRVDRPPVIDGRLDDASWQTANPASDFTQHFPDEGQAPSEKTEVRVLYDDANVYVGVRLHDRSPGEIVRRLARRDREVESDAVAIAFDSLHDHKTARAFKVNAAGVLLDAILYDDTEGSSNWDAVWDARVTLDEGGWNAELVIPLRALRYRAEPEAVWGVQVQRTISRRRETDLWVMVPRTRPSGVSSFGHLVGLKDVNAVRDIELLPHAAARAGSSGDGAAFDGTLGVDLRYGVAADLSLDVTANPDFGQVEADPSLLNLSTFESFFPEKRPFFLEGADLFQPPWNGDAARMQLFYTRRIGRAPPSPLLADGERLSSQPIATPIAVAAKLAGQAFPGWTVAAVEAFTAGAAATVAGANGGGPSSREVAAPTNFGVLRVRRDLGSAAVGATVTAVSPIQGRHDSCAFGGSPYDDKCFRGSETAGVDGRWRPTANTLVAGQLVASHVSAGPVRSSPDGTVIVPGDTGLGGQLRLARDGGENLLFQVDGEFATPKLDLNDAGFSRRGNTQRIAATGIVRSVKPVLFAREGAVSLSAKQQFGNRGLSIERELELNVEIGLPNFWWTGFGGEISSDRFDDRELRDGSALWRPPNVVGWVWVKTDNRKPVSFNATAFAWQGLDDRMGGAHGRGGNARLVLKPLSHYDLELGFQFERHFEAARYLGKIDDSYRLAPIEVRHATLTLRQSLALTPRVTLQGFAQLFFASGLARGDWRAPAGQTLLPAAPVVLSAEPWPYFHQSAFNLTAVLRWEFMPGSTMYLVYARSQTEPSDGMIDHGIALLRDLGRLGSGPANDVVMVKLAYWVGV